MVIDQIYGLGFVFFVLIFGLGFRGMIQSDSGNHSSSSEPDGTSAFVYSFLKIHLIKCNSQKDIIVQ